MSSITKAGAGLRNTFFDVMGLIQNKTSSQQTVEMSSFRGRILYQIKLMVILLVMTEDEVNDVAGICKKLYKQGFLLIMEP